MIPQIWIDRFNKAIKLAHQGQSESALDQFQKIFATESGETLQGAVTGNVLATVELRKAYCLMDLGRYLEAKAIFEQLDVGLAGQLDTDAIYDFYLAHANTLGNLGELPAMMDRLARAMNVATEYLEDRDRFCTAWYWALYWEKYYEDWESLDEHGRDAHQFGLESHDLQLQMIALEFRCYAHRALERLDEARQAAMAVLAWKQQMQAGSDEIEQWVNFLDSLA